MLQRNSYAGSTTSTSEDNLNTTEPCDDSSKVTDDYLLSKTHKYDDVPTSSENRSSIRRSSESSKSIKRKLRRFKSKIPEKQQKLGALTILALTIVAFTTMFSTPHNIDNSMLRSASSMRDNSIPDSILSSLNLEGSNANKVQRDFGSCVVKPAIKPDHKVQSTFTASYPGSGAKMTWNLIEAISGLVTGDDFQLNGHDNIVSIKTHFPSHEGREIEGAENIPRAILLIRHPLQSIPSYFNYLYEMENHLANHSTRAPLDAWITWRNNNFDRQMQVWRRHTEYWMDRYSKLNRLVMAYEKLIDDDDGPNEALKLAEFLSRSEGVTIRPPEEVPCVWHKVVKYKSHGRMLSEEEEGALQQQGEISDPSNPQSKRGGPKYVAPFNERQLRDMIQVLTQLLERYRDEKQLAPILVSYIDTVAQRSMGPPEDSHTIVTEV